MDGFGTGFDWGSDAAGGGFGEKSEKKKKKKSKSRDRSPNNDGGVLAGIAGDFGSFGGGGGAVDDGRGVGALDDFGPGPSLGDDFGAARSSLSADVGRGEGANVVLGFEDSEFSGGGGFGAGYPDDGGMAPMSSSVLDSALAQVADMNGFMNQEAFGTPRLVGLEERRRPEGSDLQRHLERGLQSLVGEASAPVSGSSPYYMGVANGPRDQGERSNARAPLTHIGRYWRESPAEQQAAVAPSLPSRPSAPPASGDPLFKASSGRQASGSSAPTDERVKVVVAHPLDGSRLGVTVTDMCVAAFTDPRAVVHGWAIGDRIVKVNGVAVAALEEFTSELVHAMSSYRSVGRPLAFEVLRRRRVAAADGAADASRARQEPRAAVPPSTQAGNNLGNASRPYVVGAAGSSAVGELDREHLRQQASLGGSSALGSMRPSPGPGMPPTGQAISMAGVPPSVVAGQPFVTQRHFAPVPRADSRLCGAPPQAALQLSGGTPLVMPAACSGYAAPPPLPMMEPGTMVCSAGPLHMPYPPALQQHMVMVPQVYDPGAAAFGGMQPPGMQARRIPC